MQRAMAPAGQRYAQARPPAMHQHSLHPLKSAHTKCHVATAMRASPAAAWQLLAAGHEAVKLGG